MTNYEDITTTALRKFLLSVMSDVPDFNAVTGQMNRSAIPKNNFAVMTPLFVSRQTTTQQYYDATKKEIHLYDIQTLDVQVDFYGDMSASMATRVETVFRSGYGYDMIRGFDERVRVLTCDNTRQMSIQNGEDQWESRWLLVLKFQINSPQVFSQDFFEEIQYKSEGFQ